MKKRIIFFFCCVLCIVTSVKGVDATRDSAKRKAGKQVSNKAVIQPRSITSDSVPVNQKKIVFHKKHRLVAALLAFPIPFGIFGLHRIYMHSTPIVPFVYIATFGGLFGVLPFIDFVLILLNKDIHLTYTSNPHLFMWQKR